ncbi:MAG: carboxypeptidase-like regulatory domain-containing protein, partial [Paramuribaculum sp.]|nr:carboxypeptidase-like regulatory domain-containing protein [Paramuribaculum sp.]
MTETAQAAPVAQSQSSNTATGVIKDELDDPMIGATVQVANNPSQGGATNLDGEFSIANVKLGTKLKVIAVGYKPVEVVWNGQPLTISMQPDSQMLDEVVVTAMGIQREEKTLTYAVQTVKNEEVTRIKETNFVNALQGK